jgi:hypothetical protein
MTRMTAITSRIWSQLPVRGSLGLMLLPKKPSAHRIIRITTIAVNMRFLLIKELFIKATQPVDQVAVELTV